MNQYETKSVWDPVTRIWHWLLAASVTSGWLIGEFRDFDTIQWHFYAGYCTGCLLLFRLLWGFIGSEEIKFKTLLRSLIFLPVYLTGLLKREPSGIRGHSPLGSLAVLAILIALTAQVSTGLFAEDDDLFSEGPLASNVSSTLVGKATYFHLIGAKVLLTWFALHMAAMLFYFFWKKENLVGAMLSGRKVVKSRT